MIRTGIAVAGGYGVWLLWTSLALQWSGFGPGPGGIVSPQTVRRPGAKLGALRLEVLLTGGGAAAIGGAAAYTVFGGVVAPVVAAILCATAPFGAMRSRRDRRRNEARDAWPRILEELRVETGSVGRSVPQAVVEVGRRVPEELRPAFAAAEREWKRSTNSARMLETLAASLADPTADAVCETLIVAAEVGGADLDNRLAALIDDRTVDLRHRKDARARQSGVRFARRFVLVVPAGMAVAGLSIGTGREAYATATGQLLVIVALMVMAACWVWAGWYLKLPTERRLRA